MMAQKVFGGIDMETGLDRLPPGAAGVITAIHTDAPLTGRLKDFGLVPGTKVRCRYRCPWGDVTALELRGSVLALRTCDLRKIRVRC